ncbi:MULTISPECIES: hypothetical protein [unclassified Streptomyces]|uniref:hypothetical protein n=1 Tax=unclassified Streptomyces TaxID=2593676 RepID=UPI00332B37D1
MTENHTPPPTPSEPSAKVRALDCLVGTWRVSGGVEGTVTYEWAAGKFFLLQHVDLHQDGLDIRGLEVIGHLFNPFAGDAGPSEDVWSRFYDNQGNTLDYVYEIDGTTLTIWGGAKGSPAYMRGTFNAAGDTMDSEWVYPGGGGYKSTMTRID